MFVRVLVAFSLMFQSFNSIAEDGLPEVLKEKSWDHLLEKMVQDIVSIGDPDAQVSIRVLSPQPMVRIIKITSDGKERELKIALGSDNLQGVPVAFIYGRSQISLKEKWEAVERELQAQRKMYERMRSAFQPNFEDMARAELKLEEILLPMQNEISNFLYEALASEKLESERARQSAQSWISERRAERASSWITRPVVTVGMTLLGFGFYKMFQNDYSSNILWTLGPFATGGVLFISWFVNGIPMLAGGNHTYLEKYFISRTAMKAYRATAEKLKALVNRHNTNPVYHQFGNVRIRNFPGSMTDVTADAWILPEFEDRASTEGVGGAVLHAGGEDGLKAYETLLEGNGGKLTPGSVYATSPGKVQKTKKFFHAVTALIGTRNKNRAAGLREDFANIKKAYLESFKLAAASEGKIRTLATPALGTGIGGMLRLHPSLSQQALLEAAQEFSSIAPETPLEITVAIFDSLQFEGLELRMAEKAIKGISVETSFDARLQQACAAALATVTVSQHH